MTGSVLVAGSTAIDKTGLYDGDFAEYSENYPVNALNVSLQLASMKTSFGGCAPNIAWGLAQLNVPALPLFSAGSVRTREKTNDLVALAIIDHQAGRRVLG